MTAWPGATAWNAARVTPLTAAAAGFTIGVSTEVSLDLTLLQLLIPDLARSTTSSFWPMWIVIALSLSVTRASNPRPGALEGLGDGLVTGRPPAPALPHATRTRAARAPVNAVFTMNTQRTVRRPGNNRAVAPVKIGDSRESSCFVAPRPCACTATGDRMQRSSHARHGTRAIARPGGAERRATRLPERR